MEEIFYLFKQAESLCIQTIDFILFTDIEKLHLVQTEVITRGAVTLFLLITLAVLFSLITAIFLVRKHNTRLADTIDWYMDFFEKAEKHSEQNPLSSSEIRLIRKKGFYDYFLIFMEKYGGHYINSPGILHICSKGNYEKRLLKDIKAYVKQKRFRAVSVMALIYPSRYIEKFRKFIVNPKTEKEVKYHSAKALAIAGIQGDFGLLVKAFTSISSENRDMVLKLMSFYSEDRYEELCYYTGDTTVSTEIRTVIIDFLAHKGYTGLFGKLIKLLMAENTSKEIIIHSLEAMRLLKADPGPEVFERYLNDELFIVKLKCVRLYAVINPGKAIEKLMVFLEDENFWVRLNTAESIYKTGNRGEYTLREYANNRTVGGNIARRVLAEFNMGRERWKV